VTHVVATFRGGDLPVDARRGNYRCVAEATRERTVARRVSVPTGLF
jgi:hypothetical protein